MVGKNRSVVYVNYSPYENAGHVLDYLLENFDRVYLFSIAFHVLGSTQQLNKFSTYEKGKLVSEEILFYMHVPQSLVFFLIPVRSAMNAFQIVSKLILIFIKYGKLEVFFSVNAFTAVIGMILSKIGMVNKNIFWVWDYYPINHPSIIVRTMRWMYWQFDKLASYSDKVIYLNKRIAQTRIDCGIMSNKSKYPIVPIGMGVSLPIKKKNLNTIKIGFIGVLKKSQGLDMLFDCSNYLAKKFPHIEFEIIGSGPDEQYFVERSVKSKLMFNFHGLVSDAKLKSILYNCTIGIAPYTPEDNSVSKYGDPAKLKKYLELNLPSIITNVFEFSNELEKSRAGIVVAYNDEVALTKAIQLIISKYSFYTDNVLKLHKKFHFRDIYPRMFHF